MGPIAQNDRPAMGGKAGGKGGGHPKGKGGSFSWNAGDSGQSQSKGKNKAKGAGKAKDKGKAKGKGKPIGKSWANGSGIDKSALPGGGTRRPVDESKEGGRSMWEIGDEEWAQLWDADEGGDEEPLIQIDEQAPKVKRLKVADSAKPPPPQAPPPPKATKALQAPAPPQAEAAEEEHLQRKTESVLKMRIPAPKLAPPSLPKTEPNGASLAAPSPKQPGAVQAWLAPAPKLLASAAKGGGATPPKAKMSLLPAPASMSPPAPKEPGSSGGKRTSSVPKLSGNLKISVPKVVNHDVLQGGGKGSATAAPLPPGRLVQAGDSAAMRSPITKSPGRTTPAPKPPEGTPRGGKAPQMPKPPAESREPKAPPSWKSPPTGEAKAKSKLPLPLLTQIAKAKAPAAPELQRAASPSSKASPSAPPPPAFEPGGGTAEWHGGEWAPEATQPAAEQQPAATAAEWEVSSTWVAGESHATTGWPGGGNWVEEDWSDTGAWAEAAASAATAPAPPPAVATTAPEPAATTPGVTESSWAVGGWTAESAVQQVHVGEAQAQAQAQAQAYWPGEQQWTGDGSSHWSGDGQAAFSHASTSQPAHWTGDAAPSYAGGAADVASGPAEQQWAGATQDGHQGTEQQWPAAKQEWAQDSAGTHPQQSWQAPQEAAPQEALPSEEANWYSAAAQRPPAKPSAEEAEPELLTDAESEDKSEDTNASEEYSPRHPPDESTEADPEPFPEVGAAWPLPGQATPPDDPAPSKPALEALVVELDWATSGEQPGETAVPALRRLYAWLWSPQANDVKKWIRESKPACPTLVTALSRPEPGGRAAAYWAAHSLGRASHGSSACAAQFVSAGAVDALCGLVERRSLDVQAQLAAVAALGYLAAAGASVRGQVAAAGAVGRVLQAVEAQLTDAA